MYLTITSLSKTKDTSRFKGTGVAVATLTAVKYNSGEGTLVGEGIATLVASRGHIASFATVVGEGYIATASVNREHANLGTAIGEGVVTSKIGFGPIVSSSSSSADVVWLDN